ncbi:MAG: hypothetical protein GF317_22695 [Candidatus Lokiarchaeota archaeon]|nr:hypothetical protein [Candidatus Lokiarchaeota archaeon]MBD3202275.1 hypothetical protein [Candidatus Lokiarchaeota archaeon]
MGLAKSFIIGLVAFLGLNFVFEILALTISGGIAILGTMPMVIFPMLFGNILFTPGVVSNYIVAAFGQLMISSETAAFALIIQTLGMVISPLVASILAGRLGGSRSGAFFGWFLVSVVAMVGALVFYFIYAVIFTFYYAISPLLAITEVWIYLAEIIIGGIVNGVFYGGIALIFKRDEFY